jgi:hypothetical protein
MFYSGVSISSVYTVHIQYLQYLAQTDSSIEGLACFHDSNSLLVRRLSELLFPDGYTK